MMKLNFILYLFAILLCIFSCVHSRSLNADTPTTSTPNTTETIATSQRSSPTTARSSEVDVTELRPVFVRNSDVNLYDKSASDSGEKMSESGYQSYNITFTTPKSRDNSTTTSSLAMTSRSTSLESSAQPSTSARTFIDILRDYEKHKLKNAANVYINRPHSSAIPAVNYDDRLRPHSLSTSANDVTLLEPSSLQGYSQDLIPSPESLNFNHLGDDDAFSWHDEERTFGMPGLKPFSSSLLDTAEAGSSIMDFHALSSHHHGLDLFPHNFFLPEIIEAPLEDSKNPTASQSSTYETTNYQPMSSNDNREETSDSNSRDHERDRNYRHRERERERGSESNRGRHESGQSLVSSHTESTTEHPALIGHEDTGMDEPSFLNYAQMMSHQMHSDELPILIESFVVNYPPLSKQPMAHGLSAFSYEQQMPTLNEGYRHRPERVLISPLIYSRPCKFDCFAPPLQDMKYGLMNFLEGAHNHG